MGGLVAGLILAMEGNAVCILERNNQLGGNLQVFSRDKTIFDTGVHYVGLLDKGETLYKLFKFLGILEDLKMKRMDDEGFDVLIFPDGKQYQYGQGYDNFKKFLYKDFPEEKNAIDAFCDKMQEVCARFPLYNLESSINRNYFEDLSMRELNAAAFIDSLTNNERLKNVLAGNNPLYAGVKDKSPFFVHALILNSYIKGSYRFVDGGSQIATLLAREIRKHGGEIFKRKNVIAANYSSSGEVESVVTAEGEVVKGSKFISNMHPDTTIDVFNESRFLPAFKKRIRNLENTVSTFVVHITLKPKTFPYLNYNIYKFFLDDVWAGVEYNKEIWPEGYFICTPASSKSSEFAESMSVMAYMSMDEMEPWKDSFNTVAEKGERGAAYEAFKREKEEVIIASLEKSVFPNIRSCIHHVYSSTPLSFRDYIGNKDGSLYGILKSSKDPLRTTINPKTRIPNLFLTGQNIIFHGILGATIGGFVTSFQFCDQEKLLKNILESE